MSVFFAPTLMSEGAQDEQQEQPGSLAPRASVLHALAAAIFGRSKAHAQGGARAIWYVAITRQRPYG